MTRELPDPPFADIRIVPLAEPRPLILSPDESARAARFHFESDRIHWSRARSALRFILSHYTHTAANELLFAVGAHGKPFLPQHPAVAFNLSHSGDYALVAVTSAIPVGIDIERLRPHIDLAPLLHRLGEPDLPSTTAGLYETWTRREARSKAAGGALFDPPRPHIHAINVAAVEIGIPEDYFAAVALDGFLPQPLYRGSL